MDILDRIAQPYTIELLYMYVAHDVEELLKLKSCCTNESSVMGKLVGMCEDLPDNLYRNSCFLSRTDVSQVQFHIDLDLLFATVCSVAYVLQ